MSRIETLRRSTAQAHAQRLAPLSEQMQHLQQMSEMVGQQTQALETAKIRSTEDLARHLVPLAEAMASLTEETRRTLTAITERTATTAKRCASEMRVSTAAAQDAADRAKLSSARLEEQLLRLATAIETIQTQPSPWPPALATMLAIVAAVAWLAWRAKLL